MSILSSLLRDVAALFFPPRCPVCGRMLAQGEHTVCTLCRATAPLTGFWRQADNPVLGRCRDMLPVERASGLLYYVHGSGWRELIRGFKYRGAWRTARAMGEWYGRCLKESGLYDDRNVEDAFAVGRPGRLAGRHVLLVDDVFTTGSTMLSCAGEILRSAPGCRISIAALAVSRHALGEKG